MRLLSAFFLALCACGGSQHSGPRLSQQESALVGDYALDGFDALTAGVWYAQDDFASWSGTLSLRGDLTYDSDLLIEGQEWKAGGTWSADGALFSDGRSDFPYALDGDVLSIHATYPSGDEEIDHWRRLP